MDSPPTAALQLFHFLPEGLAERVVDDGVEGGGGLGKQAGQQRDSWWYACARMKHRPKADNRIRGPGNQKTNADQYCHLWRDRKVVILNM